MNNIKILIQPEDVHSYFLNHKNELKDSMHIIAMLDTDDLDKKCYLFLTNVDNFLFLSLESFDTIIDSDFCTSSDTLDKVIFFLQKLQKISNELC